jgi:hypothetical protein
LPVAQLLQLSILSPVWYLPAPQLAQLGAAMDAPAYWPAPHGTQLVTFT